MHTARVETTDYMVGIGKQYDIRIDVYYARCCTTNRFGPAVSLREFQPQAASENERLIIFKLRSVKRRHHTIPIVVIGHISTRSLCMAGGTVWYLHNM